MEKNERLMSFPGQWKGNRSIKCRRRSVVRSFIALPAFGIDPLARRVVEGSANLCTFFTRRAGIADVQGFRLGAARLLEKVGLSAGKRELDRVGENLGPTEDLQAVVCRAAFRREIRI